MSRIIFVTGVSTSGKTTLHDTLKLPKMDVDDDGTPQAGALAWLAWRCEELLAEAHEVVSDHGKSAVVVTGIIWPHKVIESTYMQELPDDIEVEFVLLQVAKKDLRNRLKTRLGGTKPVGPFVDYNWGLQKRLYQQVAYQRNGFILPPTYTPEEVVEFLNWRAQDNA